MSAYSATPGWTLPPATHASATHLTRRGRLARTLGFLAVALLLTVAALDALRGEPALADDAAPATTVATRTVVVEPGDSLWAIAIDVAPEADPRRTIHAVRELNGLRSSNLQPGQVLLIPATV